MSFYHLSYLVLARKLLNHKVFDKKTSKTSQPAGVAGLASRVLGMKIKEFTFVNDCFQIECNEIFGVFLQRLFKLSMTYNNHPPPALKLLL